MSSDFLTGRLFKDFEKQCQEDKANFESLDLKKTIQEIYFSSLKKAEDNYLIEINEARKSFLKFTYSNEQAQVKFNNYAENIRRKFETDNCVFRIVCNDVVKETNNLKEITVDKQKEMIVDKICEHINNNISTYSDKLHFIEYLPQQIYESNKTHRQFLNFKAIANEENKTSIPKKNKTESQYFIDLFKSNKLYDKAINILVKNGFITKKNKSLNWIFTSSKKFTTNQTIIALCVVLEKKQYFINNPKAIYKNIKNDFDIKIDKGTYSKSSNAFKEDYQKIKTTSYSYISLFRDLL